MASVRRPHRGIEWSTGRRRRSLVMHAVVVYESMYGNTHTIAEAIGEGLRVMGEVAVVPVDRATAELTEDADMIVVGGPTHAHGMSRPSTRTAAVKQSAKPGQVPLQMDPDAGGSGLRDWFEP